MAELQDGTDDRDVGQAAVRVGDEPPVDLHLVERQRLEDLHRAVTRSEVVQRQRHPAGAQFPQHRRGPGRLGDQRTLGDFQRQDVCGQAVHGQRVRNQVGQIVADEHPRREVHRHRYVVAGRRPVGALAQRLVEHPLGHIDDQSGPFRHRQEGSGGQQTAIGVRPAQQCLYTGDAPGMGGLQRLVVQDQFATGDGGAQLRVQGEFPRPDAGHARVPHTGPFAVPFGRVQRRVRRRQEGVEARAVQRGDRDTGAGLDLDLDAVDPERTEDLTDHHSADGAHLIACGLGLVGQLNPTHDDRELIAADAAGERRVHGYAVQLHRDGLQQPVAGVMTKSVVDLAEPVDVKEHQHGVATGGDRRGDRGLGHPGQAGPVRQPRQRIPVHQQLAPAAEPVHNQSRPADGEDGHHDRGHRDTEIAFDREAGHGPRADERGMDKGHPQSVNHRAIGGDPGVPEQIEVGVPAGITVTQRNRDREDRGEHQDVVSHRPDASQQQRGNQVGDAYRHGEPGPQLVLPRRPGQQREDGEGEDSPDGKYDQKSPSIREGRNAHGERSSCRRG